MALKKCPECSKQVSDKAESCPHCGYPIAGKSDIVGNRRVRTIEKTAKTYKGQILLASLLLIGGMVYTFVSRRGLASNPADPAFTHLVVGVIVTVVAGGWLILAKLAAWWHHG